MKNIIVLVMLLLTSSCMTMFNEKNALGEWHYVPESNNVIVSKNILFIKEDGTMWSEIIFKSGHKILLDGMWEFKEENLMVKFNDITIDGNKMSVKDHPAYKNLANKVPLTIVHLDKDVLILERYNITSFIKKSDSDLERNKKIFKLKKILFERE